MRILLTTFGSYGDLHPYIALGVELLRRGHDVTLASSAVYDAKVRSEGLDFAAVRPDMTIANRERLAEMMEPRRGTERVIRFLTGVVRESYEDSLPVVQRADLVVTHPITFGSLIAVQKVGVPWVSTVLAPISLFSVYDPPVPPPAPWLVKAKALGPGAVRVILRLGKLQTAAWVRPIVRLRKELGLGEGLHPLFEGQHSPRLVLALFAKCLAERQPDWPPQTVVTGFPFYDRHHEQQGLPAEVLRFLDDGPAPLVFTLGTSAVAAAGDFYTESLKAARSLGMRAVFLTGTHPQGLPREAMAAEYAPHSELFPRAAAVVHHGGIGTTSQAMRSGRPMLVVPFSHDQFDNAERVRRLGMAGVLYRSRYNARSAERALRPLVEDKKYAEAGSGIAAQVLAENGAGTAADAVERCGGLKPTTA